MSAILFDFDLFKYINDDYGHDVGDRVLRVIAGEVTAEKLVLGRLGGEEFVVLLEGMNDEDAVRGRRAAAAALRRIAARRRRQAGEVHVELRRQPLDVRRHHRREFSSAPTWRSTRPRRAGGTASSSFGAEVLKLARGMAEGPVRARARAS